ESDGVVVARATTGPDGLAAATGSLGEIAGEQSLDVRSDAGSVGTIALQRDERPAAVTFVAGASQIALPERRFAEPVVVVVTDRSGNPVEGTLVVFEIANGEPDEPTNRTGADGRAVLRVTAGEDDSRAVGIRVIAGSASGTLDIAIRTRAELAAEAMAQGDRFLALGNAAGAIAAYGEVIDIEPETLDAWIGLGRARALAGQRDEALFAFDQALLIDPRDAAALEGRAANAPRRTVFELDVWGGKTEDNGRDAGIRNAEARIYPTENVEIHLTFDNALNLRHPFLTRGGDDLKGYYGGVGLRWGAESQFTSSFEFGKREEPPVILGDIGTNQNSFTLTQDVRLNNGSGVSFGGWYGRWFDQDDWAGFAEGRFTTRSGLMIIPSVSYGDHAGSNISGVVQSSLRAKEKEFRGGIRIRYESPSGWGVEPGIAAGGVTSDTPALDGSLFDATARVWATLGQARIQGYVRRQSPPGTPSFWTVALGLGFSMQEQ
ncbi:MAG: tetratricopeptide repeat protein, partial [Gemmatimonadota bacterium]